MMSREAPVPPKYNQNTLSCMCSVCGRRLKTSDKTERWNYCPKCGQKIDWAPFAADKYTKSVIDGYVCAHQITFKIDSCGNMFFTQEGV